MAVEIEVTDAGLHQRIRVALVDLQYPVHSLQIEHDTARNDGRGAAVTQVPARRDRIERNAELVRDPNDLLDLLS